VTLEKTAVKANTVGSTGGVASSGNSAVVVVRHSLLTDNSSGRTGGLLILNDGIGTVSDTAITGNSSIQFTGIYVDGQLTPKRPMVEDGLIQSNTSRSNVGGGVYRPNNCAGNVPDGPA